MNYQVFCAPVSGKYFPGQISMFLALENAKNDSPLQGSEVNMGLGSSGGNLAITLFNISGGNIDKIMEYSHSINSNFFARKWYPKPLTYFIPNSLGFMYGGSVYKKGIDCYSIYKDHSNENLFEQWCGTYNIDRSIPQFFCNKSREESDINREFYSQNSENFGNSSFIYCNNDRKLFSKVISASASIPVLTQPEIIMGEKHSDGGVMYASPISVFYKEISNIIERKSVENTKTNTYFDIEDSDENSSFVISEKNFGEKKHLRLFYVMGCNSEINDISENVLENCLNSWINSSSVKDELFAFTLLQLLSPEGTDSHKFLYANISSLTSILTFFERYDHYILYIYPHEKSNLCLNNFSGQDVIHNIIRLKNNFSCKIIHSLKLK